MKRDDRFAAARWDDPFWHAVRLVLALAPNAVTKTSVMNAITAGKPAILASEFTTYVMNAAEDLIDRLADYLAFRREAETYLLNHLRDEEQAIADLRALGAEEVARYRTVSVDHHQSSKAMVETVAAITGRVCSDHGVGCDVNPQSRATIIAEEHLWVSPRRLDGAISSLVNPVGLWEIKEYWGSKKGGSKMSDAIYEVQLVGQELRAFEQLHGVRVAHYLLMDGKSQWLARRSDLRRGVDLLSMGLIDELVVGSEVLTEWPRIAQELCVAEQARG